MENKNHECELLKFFRSWKAETHEPYDYTTAGFQKLSTLLRREVPREELSAVEVASGIDDGLRCFCYSMEDGLTLYYDEPLFDEEKLTYTENTELRPTGLFIGKEGVEILGPEMVVGQPLTAEKAVDLLAELADDDTLLGRIPYDDGEILDCRFRDFNLLLYLENGVLGGIELLDIGL